MAKKRNLTKAKILESARNLAEELGVQQLTFQNLAVDLGSLKSLRTPRPAAPAP